MGRTKGCVACCGALHPGPLADEVVLAIGLQSSFMVCSGFNRTGGAQQSSHKGCAFANLNMTEAGYPCWERTHVPLGPYKGEARARVGSQWLKLALNFMHIHVQILNLSYKSDVLGTSLATSDSYPCFVWKTVYC